jgi:hypothetical protein
MKVDISFRIYKRRYLIFIMSSRKRCCHESCDNCSGQNVTNVVRDTIERSGFGVMSVDNGTTYTVGMCNGEQGGFELVCTGIQAGAAASVFTYIREKLKPNKTTFDHVKQELRIGFKISNVMKYRNSAAELMTGPVVLVKITEENKRNIITMPSKYYHHDNFEVYQVLICDSNGKTASDDGYDGSLIVNQVPLFEPRQ